MKTFNFLKMKKTLYLLLIGIASFVQPGCKPDLDVPPTNIISDADIFSSVSGIEAYMARIYSQTPMALEQIAFKVILLIRDHARAVIMLERFGA